MAGLEGRTLDRYELRYIIGRGGMADVYLGYDPHFQRNVAIKVFKRDDEDLLRRFIREAHLMASLKNPHLMPIYDAGESKLDGVIQYYIVMPFMEGGTLRARIRRSPLSLSEACNCLRAIADALDYIHAQGIIHRDIKSSNVLLDGEGNCYLSDFGVARTTTGVTQATSTGNVLGTVDYVAPELFEPNHRADAYSDLYSLGVLLYEMVTGQLPFSAENQIALVAMHVNTPPPSPRAIVPTIPSQVERVMLKALEKKPEQRYSSAGALARAFCAAVTARPGEAGRASSPAWEPVDPYAPTRPAAPLVLPPVAETPPVARPAPLARATEGHAPVAAGRQPQAVQQRPPAKKKRSSPAQTRARIVTILALITLLVVVGPIAFFLLRGYTPGKGNPAPGPTQTATTGNATTVSTLTPTATPNMTATAQAQAATATAQAEHATATAIAGATATVQAHATATAGVIQTATAGTPAYADALNNANNATTQQAQWDQNSHCAFQSDGYHVTTNTGILGGGKLQGCLEAGKQFANAAYSVDITILSGHSGGLFFRTNADALGAYSGYLFEIDSQGKYKISSSQNFSTGEGNTTLQDWTPSSALKTGNTAKNTLQVRAVGTDLSFYANGVFLANFQDSGFSSGDIALLATTSTDATSADVVYSNLKVFTLS